MWIYVIVVLTAFLFGCMLSKPTPLDDAVRTLARGAARWSTAATQDQNALIAVLHANYGAGYLWAINDIVTSSDFERMTGHDYIKFRDSIINAQDVATKKAISVCPQFGPPRNYLTKIGGE